MPQNGVYDLLKMLEIALDEGYSVLKYTVVNKREIETLIDRIYQALPTEVQEARLFLKRKEELQTKLNKKLIKLFKMLKLKLIENFLNQIKLKQLNYKEIKLKTKYMKNAKKLNISHFKMLKI